MVRRVILVLGDQLSTDLAVLRDGDPDQDVVVMAEVADETGYVPHHPKKIALVLSAMGIYGVMAHAVAQRTREIGIRMALGAGAPEVLRMMLRHGLMVVGLGLGAGLAALLVAVIALLGGVALVACYIPARRATAVDPVTSLRVE